MLTNASCFLTFRRGRGGGRALLAGVAVAASLGLGAGPADAQVSCGQVITEDTTLDGDLDCAQSGPLLTIGASGITVDLGGHTIRNGGGFGILNQGHDHVTIANGRIETFSSPIVFADASRNLVHDLDSLSLSEGSRLEGNSDRNVFRNSHLSGSIGIGEDADRNVIKRDQLAGLDFLSVAGSRNRILRNDVHVLGPGIVITGNRNLVSGNTSHENVDVGIQVEGDRNVLRRNRAVGNSGDGIAVLESASRTLVSRNRAQGNGDDGIDVENPRTRLFRNTANDNGDLGIEAVDGVFARGNRASGNGNALRCLNVFCG
jgi:parallel beta-helix repeat protein